MARIVYKPHCSECGAVINDDIMYETIILPLGEEDSILNYKYTNVYPMKCKTCGAYFDCIEITPPINLTKEEDYDR